MAYSDDPEALADEIVELGGWRVQRGYDPKDVWVNGGM